MKFKGIFILSILSFFITGCNIELYNPDEDETSQNGQTSIEENKINVINSSNYTGTINYAGANQSELSKEEIYNNNITSTVYIIASDLSNSYLGSGVFFSEDVNDNGYAYLFTNAHVIENATSIEIVYSNYKRDTATLVGYHLLEDIAVLKVRKNDNYTIATINTSDKLNVASEVLTIGSPISTEYSFTATSGIISKINSPLTSNLDSNYYLLLLQIDASLNQGNSGGPLFDKYGNLIGLNTMKIAYDSTYTTVDNLNFAIPIERALFIANRIFNNNPYYRGKIGVTILDITNLSLYERQEYDLTLDYGLYVLEVSYDSAASNIINPGEVITKINSVSFTNQIAFQKELFNYSRGDTITLELYKNSNYRTVTITLK